MIGDKVRLLEPAENDLQDITKYLLEYSTQAASNFLNMFEKHILHLYRFPKAYEIYQGNPHFRKMLVDRYLVFYTIDEANKLISVFRILHGSRDTNKDL